MNSTSWLTGAESTEASSVAPCGAAAGSAASASMPASARAEVNVSSATPAASSCRVALAGLLESRFLHEGHDGRDVAAADVRALPAGVPAVAGVTAQVSGDAHARHTGTGQLLRGALRERREAGTTQDRVRVALARTQQHIAAAHHVDHAGGLVQHRPGREAGVRTQGTQGRGPREDLRDGRGGRGGLLAPGQQDVAGERIADVVGKATGQLRLLEHGLDE
jgi:hypothetical protein